MAKKRTYKAVLWLESHDFGALVLGEARQSGNQVELLSHQLEMDAVANAPVQHKHKRIEWIMTLNIPVCL